MITCSKRDRLHVRPKMSRVKCNTKLRDTLLPWLVELLFNRITVQPNIISIPSGKTPGWPDAINYLVLPRFFIIIHDRYLQGKQPLNWPLHSNRSTTLTDNLDYSCSNAIIRTVDQLLYSSKFPLTTGQIVFENGNNFSIRYSNTGFRPGFCRCRFLKSVTYSML